MRGHWRGTSLEFVEASGEPIGAKTRLFIERAHPNLTRVLNTKNTAAFTFELPENPEGLPMLVQTNSGRASLGDLKPNTVYIVRLPPKDVKMTLADMLGHESLHQVLQRMGPYGVSKMMDNLANYETMRRRGGSHRGL